MYYFFFAIIVAISWSERKDFKLGSSVVKYFINKDNTIYHKKELFLNIIL